VIQITCARDHTWTVPFVAKVGQKWCKPCQTINAREKKRQIQQQDAAQAELIANQQQQAFDQAEVLFQQVFHRQPG